MDGKRILISPLSWGYGHAGRMIPLALELRRRGCEVIFAADAGLLRMARIELAGITLVEIPGLRIRYSRFLPQYLCIFMQLPHIIISSFRDYRTLRRLADIYRPSVIISDNRFGFCHREIFSVYVTHQLLIPFPAPLRFLEPLAERMHRKIINRYDLCLVPDYPGETNLSGRLSHRGNRSPSGLVWTGPLSRFAVSSSIMDGNEVPHDDPGSDTELPATPYVCLLLSGPEPQRSLLLRKVLPALPATHLAVLSATPVSSPGHPGITIQYVVSPSTATMRRFITAASLVIARAGYSSIMELASMGKGAVLIPTPGQPEQEYLGKYLHGRHGFITVNQNRPGQLHSLVRKRLQEITPENGNSNNCSGADDWAAGDANTVSGEHSGDGNANAGGSGHSWDGNANAVSGEHSEAGEGSGKYLPDAAPLLDKAITLLLENNQK